MKRTILALFAATLSAVACWNLPPSPTYSITPECRIASVNGYEHCADSSTVCHNGGAIALPATPVIAVSKGKVSENGSSSGGFYAASPVCVIFQYRVFSSGESPKGDWTPIAFMRRPSHFILPDSYQGLPSTSVTWPVEFTAPAAIFGRNCIDPRAGNGLYDGQSMESGDIIVMSLYIIFEYETSLAATGNIAEDITPSSIKTTEDAESSTWMENRYTFNPRTIMKVTYNGKRRITR